MISGNGIRSVGAIVMMMVMAAACADEGEASRDGAGDAREAPMRDTMTAGDSVLDQIPYFPADAQDGGATPDPSAPSNDGAASPARPSGASGAAGPSGSSAREGTGLSGGDNLGGRNTGARSAQTDEILERAARAYANVRTLRADFEQTTENPVLRRTTSSRGTLYQSRPDRFAMRFSQPDGDLIVADGQYIWVYYPSVDDEQVIRMRAVPGGAGAVDLQAQFLGDPTARFDAVHHGSESVGGRPADVLTLTPRDAASFRSLKVWIDRGDALVRRFEITEHNGVTRRFLLRGLTPGADIDASVFRFTPPEGAHVVARG